MQPVAIPGAPPPGGHYSPGIVQGGFVFVSGQLPMKPGTREHHVGTIEEQTEQCLRNVEAIVKAAGSSMDRLVQVTIWISDNEFWAPVNAVYAKYMGAHRPARAVIPVKELHYGYQIEIAAIAAAGA